MTSVQPLQPGEQPASSVNKPLWAAVGILGVAVLAMGGTMIYQQRQAVPATAAPALVAAAPLAVAPALPGTATVPDDLVEKPVVAPARPAPAVAQDVAKPKPRPKPVSRPQPVREPSYAGVTPAPAPYPGSYPGSYPAPAPVVSVCAVCGSVESVTAVQRSTKPEGPGIGTVAGGVLGAVLGNQVGHGGGRTAATIIGAVGGGFAGNAIEKNVRKETVYQVGVRMEDGSRRTVEVAQPPSVGARVTVDGSSLRSPDGAVYHAPAPARHLGSQPEPTYTRN